MRLFEFNEQQLEATGSEEIVSPLSTDIDSLILTLKANNVKRIKVDLFIDELNNMSNVAINKDNKEEVDNITNLVSNTQKADVKGEYIIMDYVAPSSPEESDTQKIAMKNIRDKSA